MDNLGKLSWPLNSVSAASSWLIPVDVNGRMENHVVHYSLKEYYVTFRAQASFLTREQLDLVLLGSVMSTVSDGEVIAGRHKPAKHERTALTYMHKGHHLCRSTFNFLYGVGKHRVPAMNKNFLEYGLETRVHGNSRIRAHNTLSWDMVLNIVKFICNYTEQNAILLSGCIPTHKRDDIKLLPSSERYITYLVYSTKC